ncbi:MAG: DNA polymerase IV [Deltaproteobacteria bacterium]|nr:DNA polymerase IV [Deltaproteobacteria bacterium]
MIIHIDMDAFFAAVEQLDNPELKGQCVMIGSPSGRGVVATASYEARRFGVHSAMPMFMARKKCPQGIIVRPRKRRYKELSVIIMDLLREFTPLVEPVSIDEAYLDISGCRRLYGSPEETALQIKAKVLDTVNLTCSVGIAPCKFLAKIASDLDKPGGLTFIRPENAMMFVETLPIEKVPGVGKKTLQHLKKIGIKSLGDVRNYSDEMLLKKFGKFGHHLRDLSLCRDNSRVTPFSRAKSVSSETTLAVDTADKTKLLLHVLRHSEDVGRQLRKLEVRAKTITLKIKHADFRQFTRSVTLAAPTHSSETIYKTAAKLLAAYPLTTRIRLIGVGASGLGKKKGAVQMDLFKKRESSDSNWEKVDKAVDSIGKKFGKNTVKKASLHDKS